MRNESEVTELFHRMLEMKPDYRGDNFQFGQFMGKLEALSWLLHDSSTGEMCREQSYEDWFRDSQQFNEDMEAEGHSPHA